MNLIEATNYFLEEAEEFSLPNENSLGKPIARSDEALRNFWAWFGNSKVVDSQGRPLVVYHGTDDKFDSVKFEIGSQGLFWFTSDESSIGSGESGAQGTKHIMDLYCKITNPAGWDEYDNLSIDELIREGYDGVILSKSDNQFDGFIFNNPAQIKSASNNKGTFSTSSAKITERQQ